MKVESTGNDSYVLFLSTDYIGTIAFDSKEEIGLYLKDIIVLLRKRYGLVLKGFYEVNIYINEKVGMFIEIENIDDYDFLIEEIDLKIIIHFDSEVYFKTNNYDFISNYSSIKFLDNNYYINVVDINDNDIIKLIEFGEFVYGDGCNKIDSESLILINKN